MKSIETLINEASADGIWMTNLCQLRTYPQAPHAAKLTGTWRANFLWTSPGEIQVYEVGDAATPAEAIELCLQRVRAKIGGEKAPKAAPAVNVDPFS